ncbi:hypothetical protein Vretifemale_10663, partial [Volvox reticuliferus]
SYHAQTGISAGGASPVPEKLPPSGGTHATVPPAPQPDAAAQPSRYGLGLPVTAAVAAGEVETACPDAALLRALPAASEVLSDPVCRRSWIHSIGGVGGSILLSDAPSEVSAHATD